MHLLLSGSILIAASGCLGRLNPPTVDLGYARYQGLVNPNTQNKEFLGIRYAAPPTGNLRWRQPQEPSYEPGVKLANAQPNRCYQSLPGSSIPFGETTPGPLSNSTISQRGLEARQTPSTPPMSEDCLFLNVYSPGSDLNLTTRRKLPIVVSIHGGGYVLGAASGLGLGAGSFDGNDLIRQAGGGVVVVVIQYRLGLFGFLSSGSLRVNGALNSGLLDQEFAFKWVQRHIAKFGGDSSKVTIWGESAGAGSVLQHVVAHGGNTNPRLFRGGMLSSSFLPPQYPFNHPIPEARFARVLELSGCTGAQKPVQCLRGADVAALQSANVQIGVEAFSGTFAFVPVIDGEFIRESPTRALQKGKVNTRHILTVTNAMEGVIFVNSTLPSSVDVGQYVTRLFPTFRPQDIPGLIALYNGLGSNLEQIIEVVGEAVFVCPTYTILRHLDGNVYKGLFAIPPAYHGDDLAYYFPTVIGTPPNFPNTDFINAFSQSFMDFVLKQSPNEKHNLSSILPAWATWSRSSPVELLFNRTGDLPNLSAFTTSPGLRQRCEFWESISPFTFQ